MDGLLYLYDMHTAYFSQALDGITDADARQRLETEAHSIARIAVSLVQERFRLAGTLGLELGVKDRHRGVPQDPEGCLAYCREDWETISPVLRQLLSCLREEVLDRPLQGWTFTPFDLVACLMFREASCIGQIGLWRSLLGYPPMEYG